MPQHSVKDMLLEFSIPEEIVSVCMDEEMERQTSSPDKETEYAFGEIKVEEPEDEEEVYVDVTSDCQNADCQWFLIEMVSYCQKIAGPLQ